MILAFDHDSTSMKEELAGDTVQTEMEGRHICQICANRSSSTGTTVLSLPPEILSHIFTFTLPQRTNANIDGTQHPYSPLESPLLLTHVSRYWRIVAISHSALWSYIRVPSAMLHCKSADVSTDLLPLIKLWIERSGRTGLTVEIASLIDDDIVDLVNLQANRSVMDKHAQFLSEVLTLLHPHRHRIQVLRAIIPERLAFDAGIDEMGSLKVLELELSVEGMLGFSGGEGGAPMFSWHLWQDGEWVVVDPIREQGDGEVVQSDNESEIDIGNNRERRERVILPSPEIGSHSTGLKHLVLARFPVDIPSLTRHRNLVHLELISSPKADGSNGISQYDAFILLQSFPLLTSCILDIAAHDDDALHTLRLQSGRIYDRISLDSLKTLFVTWTFPADVSDLLDSIKACNLQNLGLRGTPLLPIEASTFPNLRTFIDASKPPLERLSLGDMGQTDMQLVACLQQCHKIMHLTLNHCTIEGVALERLRILTLGRSSEEIWEDTLIPRLETLSLGVCEGFEPETLVEVVRSRSVANQRPMPEGVAALKDVAILYCPSIKEKHAQELRSIGLERALVEVVEDDAVFPFARVVETHRELLAVVYENQENQADE